MNSHVPSYRQCQLTLADHNSLTWWIREGLLHLLRIVQSLRMLASELIRCVLLAVQQSLVVLILGDYLDTTRTFQLPC